MPLDVETHALTDTGLQRSHNEDDFDIVEEAGLYIVADGMGGHASGQVASRLAVENMRRYITELSVRPGHELTFPVRPGASAEERLLSNAIQWANERVFIESMKDRRYDGMGTTIVSVLRTANRLILGHVGDSRVYRFRDDTLEQLTRDDSLLNHYIQQGRLRTKEEINAFTERNIIVKALGLKDYVEPTVTSTGQRPGDLYLLCTDGLTDQVDDSAIAQVIRDHNDSLNAISETLVRMSNEAGGKDNCSVLLIRITGTLDSERRLRDTAPRIPVVVTFEDDDMLEAIDELSASSPVVADVPPPIVEDPSELPTIRRPAISDISKLVPDVATDVDVVDPKLATTESSVPLLGELDDSDYRFDDRIEDPNE
jgi:protein phosphatase